MAAGMNCLYEVNLEQSCKGIFIDCVFIDCYTKVVFWVKQVLHAKTPDLLSMLCEGNHHTLQLSPFCVLFAIPNNARCSGYAGQSCD